VSIQKRGILAKVKSKIPDVPFYNRLKKKGVVRCRRIFCQIAVKKMGYSGAEVARFLGVTTSAVNRLTVYEKLMDIDTYM
jgi:hypothetical protein